MRISDARSGKAQRVASLVAAQSGQAIVLFALALMAMIAMGGVLLDGGMAFADSRKAQAAATQEHSQRPRRPPRARRTSPRRQGLWPRPTASPGT